MAKTQDEINTLKQEYENITTKLKELSEDELNMITGGGSDKVETQNPVDDIASIICLLIGGKKCPYCNRYFTKENIEYHKSCCSEKPRN